MASRGTLAFHGGAEDIQPYQTLIKIIGSGGAGNNTIHHLMSRASDEFEAIAVNTDAQNLLETKAHKRILIGNTITAGLGAGGDPEIGERSAEETADILGSAIEGSDLLFITCGMGGGTGTGSVPVISRIARELGILTIAVVSMPFSEEGLVRWENAQIGLEKLRNNVDTLIVLRNDRLSDLYPDLPITEAFNASDEILLNSIVGFSNLVLKKGLINLDFADMSMVMRDGPNAVIGLGESSSENRGEEAARKAISHPMMDMEITGAQSALVQISGPPDLRLEEARKIIKFINNKLDPNARIIWGATIDKSLKDKLRVMLVVSGLKDYEINRRVSENREAVPVPEDRTETVSVSQIQPMEIGEPAMEKDKSIFDIKESILSSGSRITTKKKPVKQVTKTTLVFYKIFEEEASGDLKRFDRAIHFLRENPENRKALLDAKQACKLLHASAQMFGFDEMVQLLSAIEDILKKAQTRDIKLNHHVLDSITLAMEMVVDLTENRSDGRGETGYIVDRLRELMEIPSESFNQKLGI